MTPPYGEESGRKQDMKAKSLSRIGKIFADGRRIDEALKLAARDAIRKHEQQNLPVAIWRDGGVAWVPARELLSKASLKDPGRTRRGKRGR
jgi:hypothetical protein